MKLETALVGAILAADDARPLFQVAVDLLTNTIEKVAEYDDPDDLERGKVVIRNMCYFIQPEKRSRDREADSKVPALELVGDKVLKEFYPSMMTAAITQKLGQNQGGEGDRSCLRGQNTRDQEAVIRVRRLRNTGGGLHYCCGTSLSQSHVQCCHPAW